MARLKTPLLTVDCVVADARQRVLLIKRAHAPFQGAWALPGGFVDVHESVEDACRRELLEETGVVVRKLALVGVYSQPGRDPRGPTCSVAFSARVATRRAVGGDDAASAMWRADWRTLALAFDHRTIIVDAFRQWRARAR